MKKLGLVLSAMLVAGMLMAQGDATKKNWEAKKQERAQVMAERKAKAKEIHGEFKALADKYKETKDKKAKEAVLKEIEIKYDTINKEGIARAEKFLAERKDFINKSDMPAEKKTQALTRLADAEKKLALRATPEAQAKFASGAAQALVKGDSKKFFKSEAKKNDFDKKGKKDKSKKFKKGKKQSKNKTRK